jgi:leader peptidase (prepilin peptidase) / N-methyltransferase
VKSLSSLMIIDGAPVEGASAIAAVDPVILLIVGLLGLAMGSFGNVLISRLPSADRSLLKPLFSACPKCGVEIGAKDNIPVVSYLILRGRCRGCSTRIPLTYPIVEILGAVIALYSVLQYGVGLEALMFGVFLYLLLLIAVTDLETYLIPDVYTVGGWVFGLAMSWVVLGGTAAFQHGLDSLLVAGGLFLLGYAAKLGLKKEALGFGDVLLVGMMASFMGIGSTLIAIYLGAISGVVFYVIHRRTSPEKHIPFGLHLAVGGALALFIGSNMYSDIIQSALPWY